ncbi:glycosyltransferase family 2 protein [Pseudomonadota bacterium]
MIAAEIPSVSVIMPAYNVGELIRVAIESVLVQSHQDFEVIVLDDGSIDCTADIAERLDDPRVRVYRREHRGPTVSMNEAIQQSRGSLLAFLDADDTWAPDKLERHVKIMTARPELDMTFSRSQLMDENGRKLWIISPAWHGPLTYRDLLISNPAANGSSVVARRDAIISAGGFDTSLTAGYDQELWLRLALHRSDNIAPVPQVLNYYRRRTGQITKSWSVMEDAWRVIIEKHRQLHPQVVNSIEMQSRSNLCRYLAAIAYENKNYHEGLRLLRESFRCAPIQFLGTSRSYLVASAMLSKALLRSIPALR